jgi:enediyne biosynthesis protein E4
MFNFKYTLACILPLVAFAFSCEHDDKLFSIRTAGDTGIDFKNTIVTSDTFNALSFEYIYNGAGVGLGDFNNDGLTDIFFGGNQVSSRLYLNKGGLRFEDVTANAGVATTQWITGVSIADVNNDGLNDIYLSVGGSTTAEHRRNLLFINSGIKQGVPTFVESAHKYGLDSDAYSTMAAFFDYDKDGDLDMYLVNNWLETFNRNNVRPKRINGEAESTDQLFRNNGNNSFTNVSREAGILIEGYGLGVGICDINEDSWPDVYVANDFMSNDLLWINQQNGTFKNEIGSYLKHQTHNGMGVDIADFNNDALADILVVDMLPPGHTRQKMMTPGQNYDHFHMSLELGYEPQYMRNTLQLNRGRMPDGRILFSEISFLAGVSQTDWSWAPLFADFDNDGFKDIFIANGYRKDVTNLDFVFFGMENNPFGTQDAREKAWRERFSAVPDVKLTNYVFRNNGTLVFEDKTKDWGVELPTFSNGAAYADFDNDGDLDLVTNNIDEEVTLFENNLNKFEEKGHFIRLTAAETGSMNQKIRMYAGAKVQYIELTPYRGFQSTVEHYAHFGLGSSTIADSLIIEWTDGTRLKLTAVEADTVIVYSKKEATTPQRPRGKHREVPFVKKQLAHYKHNAANLSDIKATRTLMHELSRYGPCLAKADVNGDGLDDFFIGGESMSPSSLFIQQTDGQFSSSGLGSGAVDYADGAARFFDADGDQDQDLYVAKASPTGMTTAQAHALYLNDGQGNFSRALDALPEIRTSASCVEAADFDGDGDLDLFVGGRIKPADYPLSPRSYLLENIHGKFVDVTRSINPALVEPGIVSSACWADINNDKRVDLVLTGEWQPIRVFQNDGRKFSEVTAIMGLKDSNGWWNCIKAADLNRDGFVDFVVGNTGKNSFFQPTVEHPVQIVAKDFDNNGSMDPIVTYFNPVEKDRFIVHNRLVLIDQIPGIKRRFETFTQYAMRPFEKVFTEEELSGAYIGSAYKLESVVLMNNAGENFKMRDLPDIAQLSTINDILIDDVNGDGLNDIVAIGNMYAQETLFGRYNASLGEILLGDGNFNWTEMPAAASGFVVDGDARYIEALAGARGSIYVVTNYNDSIRFFTTRKEPVSVAVGRGDSNK